MCDLSWSPGCQEERNYLGCADLNIPELYFASLSTCISVITYFSSKSGHTFHMLLSPQNEMASSVNPFTTTKEQMWGQNQGPCSLISCLWPTLDAKERMPWDQCTVMLWRQWSAASLGLMQLPMHSKGWSCAMLCSMSATILFLLLEDIIALTENRDKESAFWNFLHEVTRKFSDLYFFPQLSFFVWQNILFLLIVFAKSVLPFRWELFGFEKFLPLWKVFILFMAAVHALSDFKNQKLTAFFFCLLFYFSLRSLAISQRKSCNSSVLPWKELQMTSAFTDLGAI